MAPERIQPRFVKRGGSREVREIPAPSSDDSDSDTEVLIKPTYSDGKAKVKVSLRPDISTATRSTVNDDEYPDEVAKALDNLKELAKRFKDIRSRIAVLKGDLGYDDLMVEQTNNKEILYNYMVDNSMEKLKSFTLQSCAPSEVRKELLLDKKKATLKQRIDDVLDVDDTTCDALIDNIVGH